VPAARADVGAVATQSFANTLYKREGMELLRGGHSAQETLDTLLAADEQREERQAGIVDARGRAATWTGKGCLDWAGGVTGAGYAIQGNILTGPEVLEAMHEAYRAAESSALPERLLTALRAGDAAGGDSRGRQSAALLVVSDSGGYTPGDDLAYDLRVDDHPDRTAWDARLTGLVTTYAPDLVVSAGFRRLVGPRFLAAFGGVYLNTHNALLPSFPGVHGPRDALAYGVKVTGATLFVVDAGVDTGAIVAQVAVPVRDDDDEESLTDRIKVAEQRQLVDQVGRMVRDGWTVDDRRVTVP